MNSCIPHLCWYVRYSCCFPWPSILRLLVRCPENISLFGFWLFLLFTLLDDGSTCHSPQALLMLHFMTQIKQGLVELYFVKLIFVPSCHLLFIVFLWHYLVLNTWKANMWEKNSHLRDKQTQKEMLNNSTRIYDKVICFRNIILCYTLSRMYLIVFTTYLGIEIEKLEEKGAVN